MQLSVAGANIYIYYIVLALALITIVAVSRLKDSRIGRALQALREDEVACEAMGIDRVGVKLMAFGLGTAWAGFAGVVFAAKTTFINPASFTFFESAIILSIVVLGGMGSNLGVILGSAFLVLLPEYMRAFSEYRMILFAVAMVLMMVFRPQGLIPAKGKTYTVNDPELNTAKGGTV
jgi:branched-chain amino acid transport system permease protein